MTYEFGPFRYDAGAAGSVVEKSELMRLIWPDTNESDENPYIETIPRRGYRFAAQVSTVEPGCPGASRLVHRFTCIHLVPALSPQRRWRAGPRHCKFGRQYRGGAEYTCHYDVYDFRASNDFTLCERATQLTRSQEWFRAILSRAFHFSFESNLQRARGGLVRSVEPVCRPTQASCINCYCTSRTNVILC